MRLKTQVHVQNDGCAGDHIWRRDVGNEGRTGDIIESSIDEVRYLRAIRGVIRRERMRNEDIRKEVKVVETWQCDHVKITEKNEYVRWLAGRRITGTKKTGRLRKRWVDFV